MRANAAASESGGDSDCPQEFFSARGMLCATLQTMKYLSIFTTLILGTAVFQAQTLSPVPPNEKTPATLAVSHAFASDWGFDLVYPSDWVVTDLSPALPVMKLESESRKNCVQRLFQARLGAPASSFSVIGQTSQCLGHTPDLVTYATDTVSAVKKQNRLSDTEYGAYSIHGLSFWVMRAKAAKIDHPDDVEILEKVIAVLPQGVVTWNAFCKDEAAQKAFEHTHIHLASGGDSEMVPASAFSVVTPSETAPKENK